MQDDPSEVMEMLENVGLLNNPTTADAVADQVERILKFIFMPECGVRCGMGAEHGKHWEFLVFLNLPIGVCPLFGSINIKSLTSHYLTTVTVTDDKFLVGDNNIIIQTTELSDPEAMEKMVEGAVGIADIGMERRIIDVTLVIADGPLPSMSSKTAENVVIGLDCLQKARSAVLSRYKKLDREPDGRLLCPFFANIGSEPLSLPT